LQVLIADEMGVGKTLQAIGVANMTKGLKRVLIIPPATVKVNWKREWEKWSTHPNLTVGYCEGDHNPQTDVLICNYDIVNRHIDYFHAVDWDILILDESHYLKNDKSGRTKFILGGKDRGGRKHKPIAAKRRLFLSATPITVRPIDLWTTCQACDPEGLGKSWWNFVHRYCDAKDGGFGLDTSGASNLEELQFKMRSKFMIRRSRRDVFGEIDPKPQRVFLPNTGLEKEIDAGAQSFYGARVTRNEVVESRAWKWMAGHALPRVATVRICVVIEKPLKSGRIA